MGRIARIWRAGNGSVDWLADRPPARPKRESDEQLSKEQPPSGLEIAPVGKTFTHETVEGEMNGAIAQMQALPTVLAPIVRIRKEELN